MYHRLLIFASLAWAFPIAMTPLPAHANSGSFPMIACSHAGSNYPVYSTWNGSTWSTPATTPSVGGTGYWVVMRDCPARNETALGVLDGGKDVNILLHNGTSWGSATQVCSDVAYRVDRPFDLAYEQNSGDLLVAYWNNFSNKIGYRTASGGALSSESLLTLPSSTNVRYVALYPRPKSSEVFLFAMNDTNDLYAAVWNDSAFGSVSTLETNAKTDGNECFAAAFESISGTPMIVYAEKYENRPRYRIWSGSSWSSESSLPDMGDEWKWTKLRADPESDAMIAAGLDGSQDINVCLWNGSSWGSALEVETSAGHSDRRKFDVAFEPAGGKALIAYAEGTLTNFQYRAWSGSSWSSEQSGPALGGQPMFIALTTGTQSGEIFAAAGDDQDDLNVLRWNGSSFSAAVELETSFGGHDTSEPFMLVTRPRTQLRVVRWREVPNADSAYP